MNVSKGRVGTAALALFAMCLCTGSVWAAPCAQAGPAMGGSRRVLQFQNEHAKAWLTEIEPGQTLPLHRHDNPRTVVALTDATLDTVDENHTLLRTYKWEAGKAYWLEPDPPGTVHADISRTRCPIRVIVIEQTL